MEGISGAAATSPIGKTYDGGSFPIRREDWLAYAAATDDTNTRYQEDVAPPMFHVRAFIRLMLDLAADPELGIDMLRLVHAEHDASFHRLLRDGDVLDLSASLLADVQKSSGRIVTFRIEGRVAGALAVAADTAYFIRGESKGEAKKAGAPPAEPPPPTLTVAQPVAADQATRYALASGDDNPIHTDPEVAKRAGLPGVILHGLCTMAFASRDLIARRAAGDPARLRRLAVRWARPVLPPDTLSLRVWEGADGEVSFDQLDGQGRPVVVNGRAWFAEA